MHRSHDDVRAKMQDFIALAVRSCTAPMPQPKSEEGACQSLPNLSQSEARIICKFVCVLVSGTRKEEKWPEMTSALVLPNSSTDLQE